MEYRSHKFPPLPLQNHSFLSLKALCTQVVYSEAKRNLDKIQQNVSRGLSKYFLPTRFFIPFMQHNLRNWSERPTVSCCRVHLYHLSQKKSFIITSRYQFPLVSIVKFGSLISKVLIHASRFSFVCGDFFIDCFSEVLGAVLVHERCFVNKAVVSTDGEKGIVAVSL